MFSIKRSTKIAAVVTAAITLTAALTPLRAEEGRVHLTFIKSRSGVSGSGNLFFGGQRYRIDAGGVSADALPRDRVDLVGTASRLRSASDIVGTYGAADATSATRGSTKSLDLKNNKGAIVELHAVDLKKTSLDLAGLTITAHGWGSHP